MVCGLAVDGAGRLWVTGRGGISQLSADGWRHYRVPGAPAPADIGVAPNGDVWFAGCGATLHRFDGRDWWRYDRTDGIPAPTSWRGASVTSGVAVDHNGVVWAGILRVDYPAPSGQRHDLVSFDGRQWTAYDLPPIDAHTYLWSLFADSGNRLWVGTERSLVVRDSGTWREYTELRAGMVLAMAEDGSGAHWFAGGGELGVMVLQGKVWSGVSVVTSAGPLVPWRLVLDSRGDLWMASAIPGGPGLVRWPREELPTAVGADAGPALPQSFGLLQNCPNPFNQQTQISFALPAAQQASLEVRNAAGQGVTTLAAGVFPAGIHAVTWDGRDAMGETVASGVYLCRLTGASVASVRKLTLLR